MDIESNLLTLGNKDYRINDELVGSDDFPVENLITNIDNQIINTGTLLGYGILKSNILYDFDIGMIQYLNYNIKNTISKVRNTSDSSHEYHYDYIVNGVIGMLDFEQIVNRLIKPIQEFYCTNKNLYMVRNYGVIYSQGKNKSTPIHNHDCDIVINICLHCDLNPKEINGLLCYYTSQPTIISKLKKNIRVTMPMVTGELVIHRGSHPNQVFQINSGTTGYRTHLIIECNFF